MKQIEDIMCIVRCVVGALIHLVAAVFVLAVLFNLFFVTAHFDVVKNLVHVINGFLGGGFGGLIALVIFVFFASSLKCNSKCDKD